MKEEFQHITVTLTDGTEKPFYGIYRFKDDVLFIIQKESKEGFMYDIFRTYGFPMCNVKMFMVEEKK